MLHKKFKQMKNDQRIPGLINLYSFPFGMITKNLRMDQMEYVPYRHRSYEVIYNTTSSGEIELRSINGMNDIESLFSCEFIDFVKDHIKSKNS